ncbi:MAG: DegT/DnrJ/EryC1/StrS family aminotransferase, partial [Anaerolineae bacterium]|nr:DegT/DnrJ/EryC1/StrS family aminotransferase [Anaerolineae bacterium]
LAIQGGVPVRLTPLPLIRACYGDEERRAVLEVLDRGVFCAVRPEATEVRALEAAIADWLGARYVVAFSSGTTAQHASLAALDLQPGDEVIVPPLTFISTAYTVLWAGGRPVFADVDPGTFNLDPAEAARGITPRTRAIVVVHWFGHAVDLPAFQALAEQHNLVLIEDCAHAFGSLYEGRRLGTFGAMACWSLQESKILTAAGEGGFLTTDDERLAQRARAMRDHGKSQTWRGHGYRVDSLGNNYRMTEIQAAFARAQFAKLDRFVAARRDHTAYLDHALAHEPGLQRPDLRPGVTSSCPYYPIRFREGTFRVSLASISAALAAEGIGNFAIAHDELCHIHPLFNGGSFNEGMPGTLPHAEQIARELLILPLYPDLTPADLDDIITAVQKVCAAYRVDAHS